MEFRQINTNTREGKLLLAALAQLSTTEANKEVDVEGTFQKVEASARVIYEASFDDESLKDVPGAIKVIKEALAQDKKEGSYYYAWQSNIAMSIYDALAKAKHFIPGSTLAGLFHKNINKGAKNFLDSFIK